MKDKKRVGGFTLIEILVVVGIMMMLSVIVLGYNRSTDSTLRLFRDQAIVIGVLNRAKALAIEKFDAPGACGFGIHLSAASQTFLLFGDSNTNPGNDCYAGGYQGNILYESGEEIEIPFEIDSRFAFSLYDAGGTSVSEFDIVFIPPDPIATSTVQFPLTIQINDGAASASVRVSVTAGGQITGK